MDGRRSLHIFKAIPKLRVCNVSEAFGECFADLPSPILLLSYGSD